MKVIRGSKALVTGAASGIGRAIALDLAREGADLYLLDIDEPKLQAVAHEAAAFGVQAIASRCDLSEPDQITAAVKSLQSAWGALNILINNAGVVYYGRMHTMSAEQWNRTLTVNLLAPIQLTRELLPTLAAQDDAHIVNICSFLGLVPSIKTAAYQTSKFGLVGFTMALRAEYWRANFGVSAICPGFVRTAIVDEMKTTNPDQKPPRIPKWLHTTPETVAAATIRAIRKNRGLVLITLHARIVWWLTRLCPGLVDWLLREGWRNKKKIKLDK